MRFRWIGGPTFLLEVGRYRVLCDPVFGVGETAITLPSTGEKETPIARRVPLPEIELANIDCVLVTRNRSDHFDRAAADRLDQDQLIFAPGESIDHVVEFGLNNVSTLDWWQQYTLAESDETLTVTAVPTRRWRARGKDEGTGNGYVIAHTVDSRSTVIYTTGETRWFSEARAIKEVTGGVDLLVPLLGAVGAGGPEGPLTLDAKDTMQFVFMFTPKRVIPIGFNTFAHYTEKIDGFEERIGLTMYERRLVRLAEGETYEPA